MDTETLASERAEGRTGVEPTDVSDPNYFHKVVDCQWACPAHTPVPEYIRKISAGDYNAAYMINWQSNVFPGILGRTCDRPCEPACRRGRLEEQPVAICRLKRVAADHKQDIAALIPGAPNERNGKRVACVGAGPASLTVARDLAAIGYEVVVFDSDSRAGGMMRSQIPKFRLPDEIIDEEVGYALSTGGQFIAERRIDSLKGLMGEGYDAIFVGCGAPRGRNLEIPGAAKPQATSISASIGSPACRSAMSRRSAGASWCSAAATRRWIAAGRRGASAAPKSRSSCAPASRR